MAMENEQRFHAAANIFPLDDEHLGELAADIKRHGQQVPIEFLDGEILDGRRRWLACKMAGVKPRTVEVSVDDPVAYVLSLNLHRRHLTVSQLGMVGQAVAELYCKQAKERQKAAGGDKVSAEGKKALVKNPTQAVNPGKSRDQAGAAVGVSGNTIDKARIVKQEGIPELTKAVEAGTLSLNKAHRVAKLPEGEQPAAMKEALKPRAASPRTSGRNVAGDSSQEQDDLPEGESRGVGVARANEAIDCLKRIPKNDRLRKRGFQIVTDWIRHNK